MADPSCNYQHNNFQLFLSSFILVGMFVSYLPQHYKIIKNKSSDGFSAYFLLLGAIAGFCCVINITLLQWNVMGCCSSISFGLCIESLMGVFQIVAQWILFFIVFILYYVYFPEERKLAPYIPHIHQSLPPSKPSEEWRLALWVQYTVLGHLVVSILITLVLIIGGESWKEGVMLWASFNGLFSTFLAMIQYFPQIYTTFKRKSTGALSIPMMMMQTPGAFLFVFSLASREGTNWTTWITYLVTGLLQGTLLILCLYYQYLEQVTKAHSYEPIYIGIVQSSNTTEDLEENEPLLNNHNAQATYEYQKTPQHRTQSLLSKWKNGKIGNKLHLVHHSLSENLVERDDTLI